MGRRNWDGIQEATGNLATLADTGPDLELLTVAAGRQTGIQADAAFDRLTHRAQRGEVPILRWGVALALDLLDMNEHAWRPGRWRAALKKVNRSLSPISIWTAWTE